MQLSNRKSKIISELLNNNDCITGQHLANITGVTPRTIREDIAQLCSNGVQIHSVSGRGYYIPNDCKRDIANIVTSQQEYIMPITPNGRQKNIFKQLILNPAGISIDAVSQQLYVSKSTLNRDLINIKNELMQQGLSLVKKSENSLCIDGDELLIRQMYKEFLEDYISAHSLDKSVASDDLSNIFTKTKTIIHTFVKELGISLTGDEYDTAVIVLTVVIFRNISACSLNKFDSEYVSSSDIAGDIIHVVETQFDIELNSMEHNYIQYSMYGLLTKEYNAKNITIKKEILEKCIQNVSETFNYKFDDDFSQELHSILLSNNQISNSEYSLVDIEMEYPLAFEMSASFVKAIKSELSINIADKILLKIVLLIACNMERDMLKKEGQKRDIVIICQSGELTNNLIGIKLKRYFPGFNILGSFPLYRIDEAINLCPELIISTVMIESSSIPVIIINPLLKDYDVVKINTVLKSIDYDDSSSYEFLNLFKEELFVKDIEAFDKYDAIKQLFDTMRKNGYAQEDFFQSVIERENITSTAIGKMVAIPHAIIGGVTENVVAVGILNKPVKWSNEYVQLVFLININNTANENIKQIFVSFFDVISSRGKVDRLIKSNNYYEFLKNINQ